MSSDSRGNSSAWMWAPAVGISVLYIGSTILTPLYPTYSVEFAFREIVVTQIYAVYVVGNLASLFALGRLSDQIGRRRASLLALGLTCISAVCFLLAENTRWLYVARVVNGFAAGLGAGTFTAWIAELEPRKDTARAAVVASAANLAGLALGALAAGIIAQYVQWPLRSSFVIYLILLIALMVLVQFAPETVKRPVHGVAEVSLRPRIGIPKGLRLAFVAPAAMAFAAFALGGFYAALAPGLLEHNLHQSSPVIIGGIVAVFFGTASLTAVVTRKINSRAAMIGALVLMFMGLGLLLVAEARQSMGELIVATVVAGAAMALGYRGSLQIINEIAPAKQRAEIVSSYLLVCYSANSLPIIGVGFLALAISASSAHRVFAAVLLALATGACAVGLRYAPSRHAGAN